jgi:hypothetical protein
MTEQTILRRPTASEALPLRSTAPEFTLPGLNGREVSLDDFRGSPVVLGFFLLDCTGSAARQLSSLQSKLPELEALGAAVLGISTDSVGPPPRVRRAIRDHVPLIVRLRAKGRRCAQVPYLPRCRRDRRTGALCDRRRRTHPIRERVAPTRSRPRSSRPIGLPG